ncbi:unnamed protein product [Caenorhabditis brenneri]
MPKNIKKEVVGNTPKKATAQRTQIKEEVVEESPGMPTSSEPNTVSALPPIWQHPVNYGMNSLYNGFPTPPLMHPNEGFYNFSTAGECSTSPRFAPYSRTPGRPAVKAEESPLLLQLLQETESPNSNPTGSKKTRKPRVSKKEMEEKIRIVDEVYWRTYNDFMFQNFYSLQPSFNSPTHGSNGFLGEPYTPTKFDILHLMNFENFIFRVSSAFMAGFNESFDSQCQFNDGEASQQMDQNAWGSYYPQSEAGVQNWGYSANWDFPNPYPQEQAFNFQQYPFNFEGVYGEMTPADSYQMPTIETSSQYHHLPLDTAAPTAPNPIQSEKKPETKSIATMLSPLNLTPGPHTPRPKRLSKQEKEVLKAFILPEDYHKKLHLARKDIKERLERCGQCDFLDHQILNLFRKMKREAARPKPNGPK